MVVPMETDRGHFDGDEPGSSEIIEGGKILIDERLIDESRIGGNGFRGFLTSVLLNPL
jgi:hypothetical protein